MSDAPGGNDPEATDLDRLIARTVPRSPHADAGRAADPADEDPTGEDPTGDDPTGEDLADEDPTGEDPTGEDLAGEDLAGEDLADEDALPAEPTGEDAAGETHADLPAADPPQPAVTTAPTDVADVPGTSQGPQALRGDPTPCDDTWDYPEPEYAATAPEDEESEEVGETAEVAEEELGSELAEEGAFEAALEALLLVVDAPVDEAALASALGQPESRVRTTLPRMAGEYTADGRGIDLRRAGEGWRFYTRDRYAPYVERLLLDGQRARLTRAALETLAVVAYRQPVTRARVSAVRGVNCDGVLRTLLTRGLVEEAGSDEQTQGTLFRTTELFLERLGLSSVQELPPLAPLLPDIDAIDDL